MSALVWTESPFDARDFEDCTCWIAPRGIYIPKAWDITPFWQIYPCVVENRFWWELDPGKSQHESVDAAKAEAQRREDLG